MGSDGGERDKEKAEKGLKGVALSGGREEVSWAMKGSQAEGGGEFTGVSPLAPSSSEFLESGIISLTCKRGAPIKAVLPPEGADTKHGH